MDPFPRTATAARLRRSLPSFQAGSCEEITQAEQQISDMSMQIAAAAEEQSAVTEEITRNVVTIKSLGDTLATNSVEGERQAHLLQGHASELNDKVGRFIL